MVLQAAHCDCTLTDSHQTAPHSPDCSSIQEVMVAALRKDKGKIVEPPYSGNVMERSLFNKGVNIGHYITSDYNMEVVALLSAHYTKNSMHTQFCIHLDK